MTTKTYEITNPSGANLRRNPSTSYPAEAAAHLEQGTQIAVIQDWTAENTVGSATRYVPVLHKDEVLYCAAKLLGESHRVTVSGDAVSIHGKTTAVWKQADLTGTYAQQLHKHGCGHCCAAMAANLQGKSMTPAKVMAKALTLWNTPGKGELYALSARGIAALLKGFGVAASCHMVTKDHLENTKNLLEGALRSGKQAILFTRPYDSKDPFGSGDHYVLAVGYDANDRIVVANSGGSQRVQRTDMDTIMRYLYRSSTGADAQWLRTSAGSAGVVIVG